MSMYYVSHLSQITGKTKEMTVTIRNRNFIYFDPAFWKYEGAQAKIVVYYSRNELNLVREALYLARKRMQLMLD
jgi:hypothetical protein